MQLAPGKPLCIMSVAENADKLTRLNRCGEAIEQR